MPHIGLLSVQDNVHDYFHLLSQLTSAPSFPSFCQQVELIQQNPHHYIAVMCQEDQLIGTITLLMEPKLIHKGQWVGHIEDLVIDHNQQGKGYGGQLLQWAVQKAHTYPCYKIILHCHSSLQPFYEKHGFVSHSTGMSQYL